MPRRLAGAAFGLVLLACSPRESPPSSSDARPETPADLGSSPAAPSSSASGSSPSVGVAPPASATPSGALTPRRRVTTVGSLRRPASLTVEPGVHAQLVLHGYPQLASFAATDPRSQSALVEGLDAILAALPPQARALAERAKQAPPSGCVLRETRTTDAPLAIECAVFEAPGSPATNASPASKKGAPALDLQPWPKPSLASWRRWRSVEDEVDSGRAQLRRAVIEAPPSYPPGLELRVFSSRGVRALSRRVAPLTLPGASGALLSEALAPDSELTKLLAILADEAKAITLRAWMDGARPTLDVAIDWRDGAIAQGQHRAALLHPLTGEWLAKIPPNTVAFLAGAVDAPAWWLTSLERPTTRAWLDAWAAHLGLDPAAARATLQALALEARSSTQAGVLLSIDRRRDGGVSFSLLMRERATADAAAAWNARWDGLSRTPLAPGVSVQRTGAPWAKDLKVEIDRLQLQLSPERASELKTRGPFGRWLAREPILERLRVDDFVLWSVDLRPREELDRRWIEWLRRDPAKRTSVHLGSFAREPAGIGWIGGIDTTLLVRSGWWPPSTTTPDPDHRVLHGALDDLRFWGAALPPSEPLGRLQLSLDLMHAFETKAGAAP